MSDTQARMDNYIRKQARTVSGWLARESAEIIGVLAMAQIEGGLRGSVGEIGIHHGKLFLLLYLSLQDQEQAFALDVFEDQQLNVDASGHGDRAAFLENFATVGGDMSRITVFTKDSCSVSAEELKSATGPLRMMSVDGGHTEEITYNDMQLAEDLLLDDGILILDDVYQERWPAVAAGAFRFILEEGHHLRPFAISPNKTYFCKSHEARGRYRRKLMNSYPELRLSEAKMFGCDVFVLGQRTIVNRVRNHQFVRDNPDLYRRLSGVLQRLRPTH